MSNLAVSKVYFDDEDALWSYYNQCGLAPALTFTGSSRLDYKKITYSLGDMFVCTTSSGSGWGFEKQQNTDVYFFSYTHQGQSFWEMNKLGRVEASQQLCVIDSSRLVQGRFSAGTHTDTIMVEANTVKQQLENIRGVKELDRVEFQTLLSPEGAHWKGLTALLTCIRNSINQEGVSDSPLAMSYLKQALVTTLIEKIPNNFTHALLNTNILMTPRHVTKTVEYIHEHADKPLMIADLARHACTSARNLQMGFKLHKNMTPMQYLREVRLLAVRKELVNEDVRLTWQKIAHKWGFTDTTLFSRYYKKRFNESPAQTQYAKKGILH